MEQTKIKHLKLACYSSNVTMSVAGNLSPILFLTFRTLYGVSYSLLGTLVLINFVTQLVIDLIFSFFSHRFNIPKTVKAIPAIALVGFGVYALLPSLFPAYAYWGLALGTVIFSAAAGLGEVLISPVIAALPNAPWPSGAPAIWSRRCVSPRSGAICSVWRCSRSCWEQAGPSIPKSVRTSARC